MTMAWQLQLGEHVPKAILTSCEKKLSMVQRDLEAREGIVKAQDLRVKDLVAELAMAKSQLGDLKMKMVARTNAEHSLTKPAVFHH